MGVKFVQGALFWSLVQLRVCLRIEMLTSSLVSSLTSVSETLNRSTIIMLWDVYLKKLDLKLALVVNEMRKLALCPWGGQCLAK